MLWVGEQETISPTDLSSEQCQQMKTLRESCSNWNLYSFINCFFVGLVKQKLFCFAFLSTYFLYIYSDAMTAFLIMGSPNIHESKY